MFSAIQKMESQAPYSTEDIHGRRILSSYGPARD